jgi:tight adherence protein C
MDETPPAVTPAAALLAAAAGGYFAPRIFIENQISKRRKAILKTWPDALDLMLICVEAGMTSETALGRVAEEMAGESPDLASELNLTTAELAYLQDRAQAWRNLADRTGLHTVRAVVTSLMQSEKYGTSLAATLRVVAQEQRDARLLEAEKKAAALPPKLTVPMILFFLPVLFVVILVPAVIKLMGA